jgi:hypothetical protein
VSQFPSAPDDLDATLLRMFIDEIKIQLPTVLDADTDPAMPKVTFKFLFFREAAAWRFWELSDSALRLIEAENYTSSMVLIRSAFETLALTFYMSGKLETTINGNDPSGIDELAMKLLMGTRTPDTEYKSVSILTAIQKFEKTLSGAQTFYDDLSEFAHPNLEGTAVPFSFDTELIHKVAFGRDASTSKMAKARALRDLYLTLSLFELSYNKFNDIFPDFLSFCQKHFEIQNDETG